MPPGRRPALALAAVAKRVEAAVVRGARLQRFEGPERFDILPLLGVHRRAVSRFGRDVRRLRPNLLIEGVAGAAERAWAGATLRIGEALIGITGLRQRCVMTTVDPDTGDGIRKFYGTSCVASTDSSVSTHASSVRA